MNGYQGAVEKGGSPRGELGHVVLRRCAYFDYRWNFAARWVGSAEGFEKAGVAANGKRFVKEEKSWQRYS